MIKTLEHIITYLREVLSRAKFGASARTEERIFPSNCLVVDDSASFAEQISLQLEQLGISSDEVGSSGDAIRKTQAEAGKYQLYAIDYNLPGLDGVDLAKELIESHGVHPKQILIFSGSVLPPKSSEILSKMNTLGFLQKPIHSKELLYKIAATS